MNIQERLREDAKSHLEVSQCCDCPPENTVNWQHMQNAIEAADTIDFLQEKLKNVKILLKMFFIDDDEPSTSLEYASLRKDAERYRWLRSSKSYNCEINFIYGDDVNREGFEDWSAEELDAEIDGNMNPHILGNDKCIQVN